MNAVAKLPASWLWIAGGLAALWLVQKTGQAGNLGQAVGSGGVDLVNGVFSGAVNAAGGVVGIPQTDAQKCAAAQAAGDVFNASLYCPAGAFLPWAPAGAVESAGSILGVPLTNADKCSAAKAAGNKWDASLYCPASDFLSWLTS